MLRIASLKIIIATKEAHERGQSQAKKLATFKK